MANSRQDQISRALEALVTTAAQHPDTGGDRELVASISDLAAIAGALGELAKQARREVAGWATVVPHLEQAQDYAQGLGRCLNHASGTLDYNSSLQAA